jgi:cytochrome c oxidase assembly protein Cox11
MGANWTVRRKLSVAPHPRRGYQPHGAHWNVQVVRAKVTTRCLWNACKALTVGMVLLLAGCAMATVGKYRIVCTNGRLTGTRQSVAERCSYHT